MIRKIIDFAEMKRAQRLPPDRLRTIQEQRLQAIIRHAFHTVPYYNALLKKAGIRPDDIRTLEDLRGLPITTKEDLRSAGEELIVAAGSDLSACEESRTTGSTGTPFVVCQNREEIRTRRLLGFRALKMAGYRARDRLCLLGSSSNYPTMLHHRFGFYRTHNVSTLLPMEEQIRRLRQINPTVLKAWPTVLKALLHKVDFEMGKLAHPRLIITSAEVFDKKLQQWIQEQIDVEMFNVYVATEFGTIASECRAHGGLHVNADCFILECLKRNGDACRNGEVGAVVMTNLTSHTMPFIRYHLGDLCSLLEQPCACGSSLPLISAPLGREEDLILLPSGAVRSATGIGTLLNKYKKIHHLRFIQESYSRFELQLVPRVSFAEDEIDTIQREILEYLAEPVQVQIRVVECIPEEKNKIREFISQLKKSDLEKIHP
jgi:phenylacetate-CoA ligase